MPVKIDLHSHGAGNGVLHVSGKLSTPESLSLTIQRNDGLYLGAEQAWQPSPHWHPQFSVTPTPAGLDIALGAEVIDGIIDAGGVPLRLTLRLDQDEQIGVLQIRGELIGSGAAATAAPEIPTTDFEQQAADELPAQDLPPEPATTPINQEFPPEPTEKSAHGRSAKWPWILLLLLLVAAGGLAASWHFGLLEPLLAGLEDTPASSENTPDPVDEPPPGPLDTPGDDEQTDDTVPADSVSEPEPLASQPALTGVALVRSYLADNPTPSTLFTRGSEAEQSGDCDAAVLLFNTAANRDPAQAALLAKRYDPDGFTPGPCIAKPDAPYAIIYYGDAATVGSVVAQRRLGQLLTAREVSGPTFEEGKDWLRRAADAGDQAARDSLTQLEQRP